MKRTEINRVLLVDDDHVYKMMVEYLFHHFYPEIEIHSVMEPDQVVQALKDFTPQILILDVNLPIQSGWEVLDEIEKELKMAGLKKPFIVMSSSSIGLDDKEMAKSRSIVNTYLEKPLTYDKLKELIREYSIEF
ncbi:MAG: response regulator [Flavobacteriales bacterium]|nr:response regulator [Flavobacteriales bacterium]